MDTKREILYAGKFLGNHMMEISWKPYDGNFLETIYWKISGKLYAGKISWKLYAGNFFGNYMLENFLETMY